MYQRGWVQKFSNIIQCTFWSTPHTIHYIYYYIRYCHILCCCYLLHALAIEATIWHCSIAMHFLHFLSYFTPLFFPILAFKFTECIPNSVYCYCYHLNLSFLLGKRWITLLVCGGVCARYTIKFLRCPCTYLFFLRIYSIIKGICCESFH